MTKLELNEKLAELYGIKPYFQTIVGFDINEGNVYAYLPLIDDSARMFDLAIEQNICACGKFDSIRNNALLKDHETTQAAARFAIALALVELKESKL